MSTTQRRVAVIGCGLIGGSIAKALHGRPEVALTVFDTDPATTVALRSAGFPVARSAHFAVADADLVVLAIPSNDLAPVVKDLCRRFKPGAIVADTGGVQREPSLVSRMLAALRDDVTFIPSNPVAGKAAGGFAHADPTLFHGATWVVGRDDDAPAAVQDVAAFARSLGAANVVTGLNAVIHDRDIAAVSHAPQLVVSVLTRTLAQKAEERGATIPAPLFDRALRLASSPEATWSDVFALNGEFVGDVMVRMRRHLDTLQFAGGSLRELTAYAELARVLRAPIADRFPSGSVATPDDEFAAHALRVTQVVSYAVLMSADDISTAIERVNMTDIGEQSAIRLAGPGFGDTTSLALQCIESLQLAAERDDFETLRAYAKAIADADGVLRHAQTVLAELQRAAEPNLLVWNSSEVSSVGGVVSAPLMHESFTVAQAARADARVARGVSR